MIRENIIIWPAGPKEEPVVILTETPEPEKKKPVKKKPAKRSEGSE